MSGKGKHGIVRKRPIWVLLGIAIICIAATLAWYISFSLTYGPSLDRIAAQESDAALKSFSYNREAALEYARTHTESSLGMQSSEEFVAGKLGFNREPGFPNYGMNCANFVSQCLLAGGIPESNGWHAWDMDGQWDVSESWRLANAQFEYFANPENGFMNGTVIDAHFASFEVPDGMVDVPLASLATMAEDLNVQPGDLIFFHDENGRATHAAMISGVSQSGVLYTANSTPQFQASVFAAMIRYQYSYGAYIVRLRDKPYESEDEVGFDADMLSESTEDQRVDQDEPSATGFSTKVQGWVM